MIEKIKNLYKTHSKLIEFSSFKLFGELIIFLFPIFIAKNVNPEVYGAYSLGMMIIFFSTTLLLGSSVTPFIISANKELIKHKSISRSFTNQLIFFGVSLSLIGILFLIFSSFIMDFIQIDKVLLIYLYIAFIGISIKSILGNYFLGIDKKINSVMMSIYYGISLIVILFLLDFSLKNLFLNYFLSSLVILLISIPKIKFKEIFPLKYDKDMFAEHWNFTKWQMFGLTAVYFINWGDSIIIKYFLNLAQVGIYNLAYQIFKGIISFMYIINTFYLPEISKNVKDEVFLRNYLFKTRIQLFIILIFGVILAIIISPFFFNNFFDESYLQASLILQVLLVGVIFKFWSIFYNPLYNVLKKYRFLQIMNIVQIIINITLGIIFIKIYGLIGVAIATTLSYFIRVVMDEIYFQTKIKKTIFHN